MFEPNLSLLKNYDDADKVGRCPYIAVFRKNQKTLIYLADDHGANKSFDMVDFCFGKDAPAIPKIAVVEFENAGREIIGFQRNSLIYAAAVATKRGIPVVLADLSETQMIDTLKKYNPNENFDKEKLHQILRSGGPSYKKGILNKYDADLDLYGRDPFMLKNIAAALNQYDIVFAIFGEGHYRSQRLVLKDMLGVPEYIEFVPNTRGDFSELKINPIKLVDAGPMKLYHGTNIEKDRYNDSQAD
jgi:hypothetical protein